MLKAWARSAIRPPISPSPTIPSRLPESSVPTSWVALQPFHVPLRSRAMLSVALRAAPSIKKMAFSATESESTPGVLKTAMPLRLAAVRSMWSVPTE